MDFIEILKEHEHEILIIHYSCSDLTVTPCRISCIGLRDEYHNKTQVFSLGEYSEEKILEKLWGILRTNKGRYLVGWNIKNPEFGIIVLKKRYKKLTGKSTPRIPDHQIIDLDEAIQQQLGKKLTLKQIAKINEYQTIHFRDGKNELTLFERNDFKALELSVGRKVKIIGDTLRDFINGNLLVEARPKQRRSLKKITGLIGLVIAFAVLDWFLLPILQFYIIALIGVEISLLAGLPKIIEFFLHKD